jgi:hypothetical protein
VHVHPTAGGTKATCKVQRPADCLLSGAFSRGQKDAATGWAGGRFDLNIASPVLKPGAGSYNRVATTGSMTSGESDLAAISTLAGS